MSSYLSMTSELDIQNDRYREENHMNPQPDGTGLRRLPPLAVLAFLAILIFIEVASIVQAIRQESSGPRYPTGCLAVGVLASVRASDTKGCRRLLRRRAEP